MRVVDIKTDVVEAEFARKAIEHLNENPRHYTYSGEGDPAPDELLAIRWNSMAILVIRLSPDHVPACYPTHQFIQKDLPPLKGERE